MNKVLFLISLFLSIMAIVFNHSSYDRPFPQDFVQGAYNILKTAEECVIQNKIDDAIETYKIAMMRSHRCGRKGVYQRIKTRLATLGYEMAESDPQKAAKFLCAYSLFSSDFDTTANKIENYLLIKSKGKVANFTYPLVYKNGTRTFWLESPKVAPIFLYKRLDPETELYKYPGNMTYLKSKDLPEEANFSYFYPISIGCRKGTRDFKIEVESFEEKEFEMAIGTNNSNTFFHNTKNPYLIKKGENNFINIDASKRYFVLNSAIIFTQLIGSKKFNLNLIREYKPL